MRFDDLSENDIAECLSEGFPDDVSCAVAFTPGVPLYSAAPSFEFTAKRHGLPALNRTECLSFLDNTTLPGAINTYPEQSGICGLGILYMLNLANFARTLGLDAVRLTPGSTVGAYVWAKAGINMDWDSDDGLSLNPEFAAQCENDMRYFAMQPRCIQGQIRDLIGAISSGDKDAAREIAYADVLLEHDEGLESHPKYGEAFAHGGGDVALARLLLPGKMYAGVFDVHDDAQMADLERYARRSFRVKAFA